MRSCNGKILKAKSNAFIKEMFFKKKSEISKKQYRIIMPLQEKPFSPKKGESNGGGKSIAELPKCAAKTLMLGKGQSMFQKSKKQCIYSKKCFLKRKMSSEISKKQTQKATHRRKRKKATLKKKHLKKILFQRRRKYLEKIYFIHINSINDIREHISEYGHCIGNGGRKHRHNPRRVSVGSKHLRQRQCSGKQHL